jgi:hypothetical protein
MHFTNELRRKMFSFGHVKIMMLETQLRVSGNVVQKWLT